MGWVLTNSSYLNQLPQVVRLPRTKVQRTTDYYETADRLVEQERRGDLEATSAQLISHESVQCDWKPQSSEKKAKEILSTGKLTEIGIGTNCRLEWNLNSIVILGDSDQDTELAVKRLEAIERAHVRAFQLDKMKLMLNRPPIVEITTISFVKTTLSIDSAWFSHSRRWISLCC